MKKLLLSLVGLFVAFAANAVDYYLIGGFNGWKHNDPTTKFTPGTNGEYILDYQGTLTSGFKIKDAADAIGDWHDDANFGGSAKLEIDKLYSLTLDKYSGNIEIDGTIINPHLVFNPSAKTLLITGQQGEAEYTYAVYGSIFGGSGWSGKDMTKDNGKWILPEMEIKNGDFGIQQLVSGAQVEWINLPSDGQFKLNEEVQLLTETDGGKNNIHLNPGKYSFTFDPETLHLLVSGEESGGGEEGDDKFLEIYLKGDINDWDTSDEYKMSTTDGVTYTLAVENMDTEDFKFATADWSKEYTYAKGDLKNGTYTFTKIDNTNTNLIKGGNVIFTLVLSDDQNSAEVTIEGQEPNVSDNFKKIYLWSSRNGFKVSEKLRFATDDGQTYTLNLPDAGSDIAFKFMVMMGEDEDVDSYRYFSNGEQNMCNDTYTILGDTPRNMTLHTGGDVTYTLKPAADFTSIEVTIAGQDHDADPYPPIYLIGSMTDWEAEEAYRLSTTDGETYTITKYISTDDEFQFIGTDAHNNWFSNADKKLVAGDYELETNLGEGKDMSLEKGGNVTFTFTLGENHEKAKLNIAYSGTPVEETHELSYILRGTTSNAEGVNWTDYKMTEKDGKWSYTAPNALVKFGIVEWCLTHNREKDWISSGDENSAANTASEYNCARENNNWSSTLTGETTYIFDPEAMKLTIENEGQGGGDDPIEDNLQYFIHGNIFGEWKSIEMSESDGKYILADTEVEEGEFGIKVENPDKELDPTDQYDTKQVAWYAATKTGDNQTTPVTLGESITLVDSNSQNLTLKKGKYTFTFNPADATLLVTGVEMEDVDPIIAYAIKGAKEENGEWNATVMTKNNGIWSVTLDNPLVEFGIQEIDIAHNNKQVNWYSAADEGKANANGTYTAKVNGTNWKSKDLSGKTTYTFDPENLLLTISGATSGINAIEAEEGDAVYFNLHGQRVANPDKGIYIRVVNGKAAKVVK